MKRLHLLVLALVMLSLSSCSHDDVLGNDADRFIGSYIVSSREQVYWGGASGSFSNSGKLNITKISGNKVQTSGFFNTTGSVSGTTLYLDGFNTSDASGYISYMFSPAILSGGMMIITMTGTGQLSDNGYYYPYHLTASITAIKI